MAYCSSSAGFAFVAEQRINKCSGIKGLKIINPLADPDIPDRHGQFLTDGKGKKTYTISEVKGEDKTVVTVLPDTAERYFSTPLFGE